MGEGKHSRPFGKKKNDWILYAYIIQKNGGSISFQELKNQVSNFKKRDCRTRSISNRLRAAKSKGFERTEQFWQGQTYVSVWSFTGDLPKIPKTTLNNWDALLSLRESKTE